MSMYNLSTNVLFIHIPKTAGTSMMLHPVVGSDKGNGHIPIGCYRVMWSKGLIGVPPWESIFKFAFVRNPWDRMVGLYFHNGKGIKFKQYVATKRPPSQKSFITDSDNFILVDFIGRFENLAEDWGIVCERVGVEHTPLAHIRTGEKIPREPYKYYYDQEDWDAVAKLFAEDIETFGYEDGL